MTWPTPEELAEALRAWGGVEPAGWNFEVYQEQKRAGLPPDGLWGRQCRAAGIKRPK